MSKPNLDIQVEPFESGKAEYLPLAPTTANGTPMVKIVLRLRLQNNEASTVTVTGITFSFPGSSQPSKIMQDVNSYGNLGLAVGAVEFWSNGFSHTNNKINNAVYLTGAAPAQVKVDVFCKDFTDPATLTLPLAPHKSPVAAAAYLFPYAAGDLRADEYMSTAAVHWANGGKMGTQIFAHDIGCVGWDNQAKQWSGLLPGTNGSKNEHYRIWGLPVRSVAAGAVESWNDSLDDNTVLGTFPDPPPSDGDGNHITIRYGTEIVTYCHFQKGSMPANLKTKGAPVAEGQMLGRAGNTGYSTQPHTHIECERASDTALRPLPFRDGWVVDQSKLSPPSATGPWFKLHGHGICKDPVAIWPLGRNPEWRGWQDLGGPSKAPPAVASWGAHRLDVFSAGTDGNLKHTWWDGATWHTWQTLGGVFKGGPAAVSWGANRIDVFVRGMDDHLGHLWWNGSQWNGWQDLGGPITSAPAVASWAANRLDVFAAGSDGNLKHTWWDGATWSDWDWVGGVFYDNPAAVSWGANRIDVVVHGMDDHLAHLWRG